MIGHKIGVFHIMSNKLENYSFALVKTVDFIAFMI